MNVPVLGMVDDVMSVAKCSSSSVTSNATINLFMELNKLKLAEHKCAKIHVGRKNSDCPTLQVQGMNMKNSYAEKYN